MNMNVEQQKKYESYFLKQSDKTLEFSAIMKEIDGFKNATVLHARRVAKLMIDFIVDEVRLVTKSKVQFPTEDKFKTIVALYDKDVVEGRLMKDKEWLHGCII